jgi:outer membrane lipoprotein-sorting protein
MRFSIVRKVCTLLSPVVFVTLVDVSFGQSGLSPESILQKMDKAYSELTSYQDTGVITNAMDRPGSRMTMNKDFAIWFRRPELLRVDWTSAMFAGTEVRHVLWNNGKDTYVYSDGRNQYKRISSLGRGISSQAGVSGLATVTVPSRLIGDRHKKQFTDTKLLGDEEFEGTRCFVISCKNQAGYDCKLWIGENDFLLRKFEYEIKSIKKVLKDIQDLRKEGKTKSSMPDPAKMPDYSSVSTEIHRNIKINEQIADSIFNFSPPEDARLVETFKRNK